MNSSPPTYNQTPAFSAEIQELLQSLRLDESLSLVEAGTNSVATKALQDTKFPRATTLSPAAQTLLSRSPYPSYSVPQRTSSVALNILSRNELQQIPAGPDSTRELPPLSQSVSHAPYRPQSPDVSFRIDILPAIEEDNEKSSRPVNWDPSIEELDSFGNQDSDSIEESSTSTSPSIEESEEEGESVVTTCEIKVWRNSLSKRSPGTRGL